MNNSKFFEFLKLIKGKIKRDLYHFIPISSNQLSIREKELFIKILNELEKNKELKEEEIIKIFLKSDEEKNWNRIKNHFSRVIKRYLIMILAENHQHITNNLLLNFYSENNLDKNFKSMMKKEVNALTNPVELNQTTSFYLSLIHELKVSKSRNLREEEESLKLITKSLDNFYLENKLRYVCEQINRKHVINTNHDSDSFISYIKENLHLLDSLNTKIYWNIYKMLTTKNSELNFENAHNLLLTNLYSFSAKYAKEILDHLMNYCIRKINYGKIQYAQKYLDYIDILSKDKLFIVSWNINSLRLKNCITISLIANKVKWAEHFLESNLIHLNTPFQESVYKFNKAQIQFYKKNYDECQELLVGFSPFDMYYKLAYDKLLLKINYTLYQNGNYDILFFKQKIKSTKN